jgi:restriction endonuclease S subunit
MCGLLLTTKNSVLLCNVSEAIAFYTGTLNQQIFLLEPNISKIEPNFLYYLLCSQKTKLNFFMKRGTVYKSLTKTKLKNFPISLPLLFQQRQILSKFQLVYNDVDENEINYNNTLLEIFKKHLEIGDLLFAKFRNDKIRIKERFQVSEGRSGTGLRGYSESIYGTVK